MSESQDASPDQSRDATAVDTLIFDQGGVLVWTRWHRVMEAWAILKGTEPQKVMDRMREGDAYAPFMRGEITRTEFRERMCGYLDIRPGPAEFDSTWRSVIEPNLEIVSLIERLAGRFTLVIGSNTDELHQSQGLKVQPIIGAFDHFLLSYELGVLKPDPDFFRKGLESLELSPERCLFIDDRQDNVDSASEVGLRSVRYESVAQLEVVLGAHGLT